jgi:hypothetical protein
LLAVSAVAYFTAYFTAYFGTDDGQGPAGLPVLAWQHLAMAVAIMVYALIVADFFRWRCLSGRS